MFRILFLLLVSTSVQAQNTDLYVVYDQLFDNFKRVERKAFLYANEQTALYEDDLLTQYKQNIQENEKWQKEQDKKNQGSNTKSFRYIPEVKYNKFYKLNRTDNTINYVEPVVKDHYVYITDKVHQNWKLTNEKKIINDIECFKATTRFRGTDWEVWYAPSIPYPYGPWKLHGLPGLIVQANDFNKRTNYSASKIEFKQNDKLNKELAELVTDPISEKVTLQKFVEMRDEILDRPLQTNRDTNGTYKREVNKRPGVEKIYEWEEDNK